MQNELKGIILAKISIPALFRSRNKSSVFPFATVFQWGRTFAVFSSLFYIYYGKVGNALFKKFYISLLLKRAEPIVSSTDFKQKERLYANGYIGNAKTVDRNLVFILKENWPID